MNQFIIMTDSACDLPLEIAGELGIKILPFRSKWQIGARAYTSVVSATRFEEEMLPALESGLDIFYIGFSSSLSTTYSNALETGKSLQKQYPQRRIYCLDSKSASLGQGLLVYLAAQKKQAGANWDEVISYAQGLIPHICHWFTVTDLSLLKQGGRINATTANVSSKFHMLPILHMNEEGQLVNVSKVRGRKAVIDTLLEKLKRLRMDETAPIMISYDRCWEDAKVLADRIKADLAPVQVITGSINPVISSHVGAGTLSVFFIGTHR